MVQMAANTKNYYEILGVDREASVKEIKKSYHELARLYHPDSNFYADIIDDKLNAEQIELFKVITSAYQTLIDPQKREQYDTTILPNLRSGNRVWDEEKNEDDFWIKKSDLPSTNPSNTQRRRRTATFGQTGARPFKATLHDGELKRSALKNQSVNSIIKTKKRKNISKILIPVTCALTAGIAVSFILFFAFGSSSQNAEVVIDNVQNSAPTESWRNNLNN